MKPEIQEALDDAAYFGVADDYAHAILTRMMAALTGWRRLARSPAVGMDDDEIDKVTPAFENDNWDTVTSAPKWLGHERHQAILLAPSG